MCYETNYAALFFPHHFAPFSNFNPFPLHLSTPPSSRPPGPPVHRPTSFFKFGACVTLSQKPQITPLQQQRIRNNSALAIKKKRTEREREVRGKYSLAAAGTTNGGDVPSASPTVWVAKWCQKVPPPAPHLPLICPVISHLALARHNSY